MPPLLEHFPYFKKHVRVDVSTKEKDKSTTYVELIIQLIIIQLHRTANSTQRYDTTQLQYF